MLHHLGVLVLCFFLALGAQTATARTLLRVGVYDNAPVVYQDEHGEQTGFAVEILKHVAEREGWELQFVPGTWPECLERLERGDIDIQTAIAYSPERARRFAFNEIPLFNNWGQVFTREESTIEQLADLEGQTLALLDGDVHSTQMLKALENRQVHVETRFFGKYMDIYRAVQNGEVEAGLLNRVFASRFVARHRLRKTSIVLNVVEIHYGFHRGVSPLIINKLDNRLRELKEDRNSVFHRLMAAFLGGEESMLPAWFDYALGGGIMLLALFLAISLAFRTQLRRRTEALRLSNIKLQGQIADRLWAEQHLKESEERLRIILDTIPTGILLIDPETHRVVDANPAAQEMLAMSRDKLINASCREAFCLRDGEQCPITDIGQAVDKSQRDLLRPDGRVLPILKTVVFVNLHGREHLLESFMDLSLLKKTEAELLQQTALFQQLFENSPQAIAMTDDRHLVTRVNRAFEWLFGYVQAETAGKRLLDLIVPEDKILEARLLNKRVALGQFALAETVRKAKNGREIHISMLAFPLLLEGERQGAFRIFQDITERKRSEERLLHQAFHDHLTGLPNRALFLERLRRTMDRVKNRPGNLYAVLFLDLDRFKVINDSLGHNAGDELIIRTGRKLQACVSAMDTVARVGGDSFAILIDPIPSPKDARLIAERLQSALRRPITVAGRKVHSTASIGLVVCSSDNPAERPEYILRDADIAMYRAKDKGKDQIMIFEISMREQAAWIMHMEHAMRDGLERKEFEMYYQPIVDLATDRLAGFEALLRWRHPDRGLVPPSDFIWLAEDTGLILPLGFQALVDSCRQLKAWREAHPELDRLEVSVNLSARQFNQLDLAEQIRRVAEQSGLELAHLKLEITESVVMENAQAARAMLQNLRQAGARLSVDDFGTGYSSLAYLQQFPIDTLKVDRSFVSRISGENQGEIVRAIVVLAHNLGLNVVAEGVETSDQAAFLKGIGCDYAQGFLYSRPLPAELVEKLLRRPRFDV